MIELIDLLIEYEKVKVMILKNVNTYRLKFNKLKFFKFSYVKFSKKFKP